MKPDKILPRQREGGRRAHTHGDASYLSARVSVCLRVSHTKTGMKCTEIMTHTSSFHRAIIEKGFLTAGWQTWETIIYSCCVKLCGITSDLEMRL